MLNNDKFRLHGLCESWIKKIHRASEAKKPFNHVAEQCEMFFNSSVGFMWNDDYRSKFMRGGDIHVPRFRITVAKAFELVATFGPSLFWHYPGRVIKPYDPLEIDPLAFGDPNDPNVQSMIQQFMLEQTMEDAKQRTRNGLMEKYLNYSQREQPDGGLKQQSMYCITDALVKGRGCLWTEKYSFPESERVLTGCFYDSVDNLFIDPDCKTPDISKAKWIARRHEDDYWEVERRFGLPDGYLKRHAKLNADDTFSGNEIRPLYRTSGLTCPKVVWFEFFSRGGVGSRFENSIPSLHGAFDEIVGDHAYICVARGVPCPLNMPPSKLEVATDQDILEAFDWPVPYYKDSRWPVAMLDFYPNINSPWPIAPMSMGLGELYVLNVMMAILADRAYENSRTLIGVAKHACEDLRAKLQSGELREIIEFNADAGQSLREVVDVFKMPELGGEILNIIDYISRTFDKRTGLTELLYGGNAGGTQSRTAADASIKAEMANVRPAYMQDRVEDWQTEAANLERICAGWNVRGQDVEPLFGKVAAPLWDQLIANEDPELYVRQMRATVEANSIRKPNKVKDNKNLAQLSAFLLPELSKHADMTTDTAPLNAFIKAQGDSMDQKTTDWMMGPRKPPEPPQPSEEEMMMMMQQEEAMAAEQEDMQMQQQMRDEMQMEKEQLSLEQMNLKNAKLEGEVFEQSMQPPMQLA